MCNGIAIVAVIIVVDVAVVIMRVIVGVVVIDVFMIIVVVVAVIVMIIAVIVMIAVRITVVVMAVAMRHIAVVSTHNPDLIQLICIVVPFQGYRTNSIARFAKVLVRNLLCILRITARCQPCSWSSCIA